MARLIKEKGFSNRGIAALSFTNVATLEIKEKLKSDFGFQTTLTYPHFIGTIDKFINAYIFLPHGHLLMGCTTRPELVGEPNRPWNKGKGDKKYRTQGGYTRCIAANPDGYFDCASFDINDELYAIVPPQEFHFSLKREKYYNKDGTINKRIQDVIDAKNANFKLGYATQADANYLSWKILESYPLIAQCIANKFEYFIVDEAQDTDAIQMKIIEILQSAGANNIMLIGDRDQSIYEWNNADPTLFDEKYKAWDKIELDENWRSSQKICNFTQPLSTFTKSFAKSPSIFNYDFVPEIKSFVKDDPHSMFPVLRDFFATVEQNGIPINIKNVAVLYRGKAMLKYLGKDFANIDYELSPWLAHNYHVRDIILGKYLYEQGEFEKGYRLLEKGFFEAQFKIGDPNYHCNAALISKYIEQSGFWLYRQSVYKFINCLPSTESNSIRTWITKANQQLKAAGLAINLISKTANSNVQIHEIFRIGTDPILPYHLGTIHSIKGKTFEAVLLLLDKRAGTHSYYSTILQKGPKPEEEEELRCVYVALTRPRKILMMAVPDDDLPIWSKKLIK